MEKTTTYTVEITAEAERFYFDILTYFYKHHSEQSADRKSNELIDLAISLETDPHRGTIEESLKVFGKNHRFILYFYTPRKAIKIIYFIDEFKEVVYVTDFFPCQMNDMKINKRTK